jgi:DNA-binding PadR family transcriptional regulator
MKREKKTRYALLGLLSIGPSSGYGLKQRIQHTTAHFWSESYGQIYPELSNLEEEGLLSSYEEKAEGQGPGVRRVYAITESGLAALKSWLQESPSPEVIRDEFLLKIFFGVHADPEALLQHLHNKQRELQHYSAYLTETARWILNDCKENPHAPYWLMAVRIGASCAETQALELKKLGEAISFGELTTSHAQWLAVRKRSDIDPTQPIRNLNDETEDD